MTVGLLIAETPDGLRKDLRRLFFREFPGIQIDEAGTSADAEILLGTDRDRDVTYVLVILNAQLLRNGEEPVDDPRSWLQGLPRKPCPIPHAYFIVSATPGDHGVGELPETARRPGEPPRPPDDARRRPGAIVVFPRGGPGWGERLLDAARPVVHPERINARIDEVRPLFGRRALADPIGGAAPPVFGRGVTPRRAGWMAFDPTQRLANLVRDIETNWKYLGKNERDKVQRYFVVRPAELGGVVVSLL